MWNIACDIVVNDECSRLLDHPVPEEAVQVPDWYNYRYNTTEEVYDRIFEEKSCQGPGEEGDPNPSLPSIQDGTDLIPSPPNKQGSSNQLGNTQPSKEWRSQLHKDVAQAATLVETQQGPDALNKLPEGFLSRLEEIKKGDIPFGRLLRGRLQAMLGHDNVCWTRPKKNMMWAHAMRGFPVTVAPSYLANKERNLLILVDVSASVSQEWVNKFASNIENAARRATNITIASFDSTVREVFHTTRPKEVLMNIKLMQGAHGYTSAVDAFALAEEMTPAPSAIVCFTDGYIYLPEKEYPQTLWVHPSETYGGTVPASWGRCYLLDQL